MLQTKRIVNRDLIRVLDDARDVVIVGHISPDGDCIGSMLAAGRCLEKRGKRVSYCLQDPVPENLRFLTGAERILPPGCYGGAVFDLGLAVDCANEGRMGEAYGLFRSCPVTAQIDHHAFNPEYASVNEVDENASCAGCMVWRLMGEYGLPVDIPTAEHLYCAVSTDTGRFCFSSTDEEAFLCAADAVASGFDLNRCARQVHLINAAPHLKLLARGLESLRFFAGGRCTSMVLTAADFRDAGAGKEHADGISKYGLDIPGVCMSYLADLSGPGPMKISFRAVQPFHVNDIAALLGGGGHVLASGCRTNVAPERAFRLIEEAMEAQAAEMKNETE